jgi:ATP-dependent Clp protease ATP-binding subunit ClpX
MAKDNLIRCSFCGRDKREAKMLIAGQQGHICDHCVAEAFKIVSADAESLAKENASQSLKLLKPHAIKEYLDQYIVGQDEAKKIISVAVYNHFKRVVNSKKENKNDIEIEKSNVIMVGETGTGKTLIARTIAKLLNVPFCIADATVFTEAGYVGEDVESIITRLLQESNYDVAAAERGIVFIDEIDKISRKGDNPSLTRDIKEGTQQALLKLLEDSIANVPPQGGRKHPDAKMIQVNTKNILFICGGAFDGIDKMIAKRLNTQAIGFGTNNENEIDKENMLQYVSPQDLKSFGLIPELIGRLPVLTYLNPLDRSTLKLILTQPKNALIKQYEYLFEIDGVKLKVEPAAIEFIVDKAMEFKLGARGLRSICEAIMLDAMFDIPSSENSSKTFTLTFDYAKEKMERSKLLKLKAA